MSDTDECVYMYACVYVGKSARVRLCAPSWTDAKIISIRATQVLASFLHFYRMLTTKASLRFRRVSKNNRRRNDDKTTTVTTTTTTTSCRLLCVFFVHLWQLGIIFVFLRFFRVWSPSKASGMEKLMHFAINRRVNDVHCAQMCSLHWKQCH